MAIILDITDDRGVVTNYHSIESFRYEDGKLLVSIRSYVGEDMRKKEKKTHQTNLDAKKYDKQVEEVQDELDQYVGIPDKNAQKRAIELTKKLNELSFNEERPQHTEEQKLFCATNEIELEYFEPLSLEAIYKKLMKENIFSDSKAG